MKLAVTVGHGLTPSQVVQAAKRLEGFGYDHIWLSESVGLDAFSVLGGVAAGTKTIGMGPGIVNVYSRAATQIAMAAATVEEMSFGRLSLGIGSGSQGVVSAWHGLEFTDQLGRMERYIDTLKLRLRQERSRLQQPFPSVSRDIPIIVACVLGRMLALASRKADGALFFMRRLSDIRERARELSTDSFRIFANVVTCVSADGRAAEKRARKTVAYYLTYGDSYRRLIESQDDEGGVRAAVAVVRSEWLKGRTEEAARNVPGELLGEVSIYGTASQCARKIGEYASIKGLSMLGLQYNPGEASAEESIGMLSSFPKTL